MPSVLWRCWLGGRKGIRPVKTEWWGTGMVICLERYADLHMVQLMPLPLTVSCFSKIQIGFTFLVPAHPGSPGKRAVNWCVLLQMCVDAEIIKTLFLACFFQASVLARQSRCRQSRPTNSTHDCYVMHNVITAGFFAYCIMKNYHTPRPLAAFILFHCRSADGWNKIE